MTQQGQGEDNGSPHRSSGILSQSYSRRIFGILLVVVVGALSLRAALVPDGFGVDGHYRVAAPGEAMAQEPVHQGKAVCGACHDDELAAHEKDVHINVQCEDCHGPGREHVRAREDDAPDDQGPMFRELEQANCLACHGRLMARPKLFPTIDVAQHFALVGVKDPATKCQECHSPHEPLFLERPVAEARIHPLIHACGDCHHDPVDQTKPLPEGHVVTFRCGDCHADVVASALTKPHAKLDCRVCHVFRKDSEFSGRIFKNANPQFCLMCHQDGPFKDGDAIPLLESFEKHREEMADSDEDKTKRCGDCHLSGAIHDVSGRQRSVVTPPARDGVAPSPDAPDGGQEP